MPFRQFGTARQVEPDAVAEGLGATAQVLPPSTERAIVAQPDCPGPTDPKAQPSSVDANVQLAIWKSAKELAAWAHGLPVVVVWAG